MQPLPVILSGARNPRAALSQVSESQVSPSHFLSAVLLISPVFFFFFFNSSSYHRNVRSPEKAKFGKKKFFFGFKFQAILVFPVGEIGKSLGLFFPRP